MTEPRRAATAPGKHPAKQPSGAFHRLDVRYPPTPIRDAKEYFPSDFSSGEHGVIMLNMAAKTWLASQSDPKALRLAQKYFGATSGNLAMVSSGNMEMRANGKCVGVFNLADFGKTNICGVIGTSFRTGPHAIPGTGVEIMTARDYTINGRELAGLHRTVRARRPQHERRGQPEQSDRQNRSPGNAHHDQQ